jgi:hypothetical protein
MRKLSFCIIVALFAVFNSNVFAASISGTISYSASYTPTGNLVIMYAPATGPGPSCTPADWGTNMTQVDQGIVSFPYPYTLTIPAGTYCVGAYVDNPPTGFPPSNIDSMGVYSLAPGQLSTVITDATGIDVTLYDLGNLTGSWDLTVNVDILSYGGTVDCTYIGNVNTYNVDQNDLVFGGGPISSSTGTLCPTFIELLFQCDTSVNPITCSLMGPPSTTPNVPYGSQVIVSNNNNKVTGSLQGTVNVSPYGDIDYTAEWILRKNQTSIPTMTEWGMIIFVVLAGLGAAYYLRRQKRAES